MNIKCLLLTCVVIVSSQNISLAFAAKRPNIVWLISEDNSSHYLKLFDSHGVETPAIAKMAEHGLIFENAFSNSPVCSVARSTLITGCYAPRIGTQYHRKYKIVPLPEGLEMFPVYLRRAGYHTTNNVKTDYNAIQGRPIWDETSRKASWHSRKPGQPFFHQQSFTTTHESSLHFSAESMKNDATLTDPETVFVAPYHPNTPTFRYTNARYRDNIRKVDAEIGKIVEQLRDEGLLEDTFVFYFGDHGGVLPRGKGYAYESGLHVPLVVRVPENYKHLAPAAVGSRISGFVNFIDFGPTALKLAGINVPAQVDGKPFLGQGIGLAELNQRDFSFGYADRFDEKYDLVRTIRKGRFEYVRNYQPFNVDGLQNNYRYRMLAFQEWRALYGQGKLNAAQREFFERRDCEALYDIENDPHEVSNLAGDPQHAQTLARLRKLMEQTVDGLPDLSLYPENYLIEKAFDNPVAFGKSHQKEIARLNEIANLSLLPFGEAKTGIEQALNSTNDWERYWGLIVCSCFAEQASPFVQKAKQLAGDDKNLLVRTRAAEFLGLIKAADPAAVLLDALKKTDDPVEAVLIFNTVVLLQDHSAGYRFNISHKDLKPELLASDGVQRRLDYLDPSYQLPKKKRKRKPKKKR